MNDFMRESLSYFGLFWKMARVQKRFLPEYVSYGAEKDQYFLYYEPETPVSDTVIFWVHGGGWNAGNPKFFDFVGQCMAREGYRMVSFGYRLSPKHTYPAQIEDVCACFNAAVSYLERRHTAAAKIIVAGPSAGAHLSSILCYSKKVQKTYGVDLSRVIGFIGSGGPYSFRDNLSRTLTLLLNQLFQKGYDRQAGEPLFLMEPGSIPMLLIQSRHDGLVAYECAEDFARKAERLGIPCELYSVTDKKDTHSWYTAGMFLESRQENKGLDKFFSWIEAADTGR